jgi:hypothetical protein
MSKRILPVMFGLPQIVAQGPGTFLVTAQDRLAHGGPQPADAPFQGLH